ncbi:MAG: LysR family transcriptional regulator, partial [Alphaproteobacteria bacterium HGW-Alphaproteobacteria-16]
ANDDRALEMVRAGLGITVVPASYRQNGVANPILTGFDLERRLCVIWGEDAGGVRQAALPVIAAIRTQFGG